MGMKQTSTYGAICGLGRKATRQPPMVVMRCFLGFLAVGTVLFLGSDVSANSALSRVSDDANQASHAPGAPGPLPPTQAAADEWRRFVCEGDIAVSYASEDDLAAYALSPAGTLLPPGLSADGFVEGWQRLLAARPNKGADTEGAPADDAQGAALVAKEPQRLVPLTLAFILPALLSFWANRRYQNADPGNGRSGLIK